MGSTPRVAPLTASPLLSPPLSPTLPPASRHAEVTLAGMAGTPARTEVLVMRPD